MTENLKKDVEMKDIDKKEDEKKVPEVVDPFFGMFNDLLYY